MISAPFRRPIQGAVAAGDAAAGPITLILDQFTDANGTALASHTIAPTNTPATAWTLRAGTADIQSNRLNPKTITSEGTNNACIATCDAGNANVSVSVIVNNSASNYGGLVFRYTNNANYWLVSTDVAGNTFTLYEKNAGTFTQRATASVTVDPSVDYALRVILSGTSISATLNGANTLNYTSAFNQSATMHGVRLGNTPVSDRFDDFTVTIP